MSLPWLLLGGSLVTACNVKTWSVPCTVCAVDEAFQLTSSLFSLVFVKKFVSTIISRKSVWFFFWTMLVDLMVSSASFFSPQIMLRIFMWMCLLDDCFWWCQLQILSVLLCPHHDIYAPCGDPLLAPGTRGAGFLPTSVCSYQPSGLGFLRHRDPWFGTVTPLGAHDRWLSSQWEVLGSSENFSTY